jgi:hypothetical protein
LVEDTVAIAAATGANLALLAGGACTTVKPARRKARRASTPLASPEAAPDLAPRTTSWDPAGNVEKEGWLGLITFFYK